MHKEVKRSVPMRHGMPVPYDCVQHDTNLCARSLENRENERNSIETSAMCKMQNAFASVSADYVWRWSRSRYYFRFNLQFSNERFV